MTASPLLLGAAMAALLIAAPIQAAAQNKAVDTTAKRVFVPADFARYAPKTAYDMLAQVPSFTIRAPDQQEERGLGQASENVLIDGQRVADKSGGAVQRLKNTSASAVARIEIVDAAQLGIAGLSGQVANVILANQGATGQFEWKPEFRPHFSHPNLLRGSASYSDRAGPVDYTLSVDNDANRGAYGGDQVSIYGPDGTLTERRDLDLFSDYDHPEFTARAKIDAPGTSIADVSAMYEPYWSSYGDRERRNPVDAAPYRRDTEQTQDGYIVEFNGDYEFALGPGRLKLIGLRHFEHQPTLTDQITTFLADTPATGTRFTTDARIGETVLRGEYHWKSGKNDWQLSFERAVNTLDQVGLLYQLDPAGDFENVDYPQGSGQVIEHRYEGIASFSRPLSPRLDLQAAGGAEISALERLDGDIPPRHFFRPKGNVSLAWRFALKWDASVKLSRTVGQISFQDFLAQPDLMEDRENAGNPDLVPPQSWELETEIGHDLGAWGKTRLKLHAYRIDDIVDIVPIGTDGESIGNLPRANKVVIESTSTIQFDPLGWHGAKLDATFGFEQSSVRDPLTGKTRPIGNEEDYYGDFQFRDDLPHSDFAWGSEVNYDHFVPTYYLTEVNRTWEGPVFASVYIENKNVFGMTVRATVTNFLDARHKVDRTVYEGYRDRTPISFHERQNELIGPIFTLSIKGTF